MRPSLHRVRPLAVLRRRRPDRARPPSPLARDADRRRLPRQRTAPGLVHPDARRAPRVVEHQHRHLRDHGAGLPAPGRRRRLDPEPGRLPRVVGQVFLFSNMVFLPLLFLLVALVLRARLSVVEGALFVAIALVFLFNNLGPPNPETAQIARRVHPAHLPAPRRGAHRLLRARDRGGPRAGRPTGTSEGDLRRDRAGRNVAGESFGRVRSDRARALGGIDYQRFYFHAYLDSMDTNLALYGRRPLGFCSPRQP